MNAEELRKKIGNRAYNQEMKQTDPDHFAFLMWHETFTKSGGTNIFQHQLLQVLDDEELMARYVRFKLEQGE